MRKFSFYLALVSCVAVVAIVFSSCTQQQQTAPVKGEMPSTNGKVAKVVYINTDTLMSQYLLAIELNEAFLKTQEERRTELNVKAKSLDQEANEFQRKLQNNGFLSEARAIEARDQLLVKERNFRRLQEELMEKTAREQNELNKQLFGKLTAFLQAFSKAQGFDIVLSTQVGGNVLFAVEGYDITKEVVNGLNEEYKKENRK